MTERIAVDPGLADRVVAWLFPWLLSSRPRELEPGLEYYGPCDRAVPEPEPEAGL